MLNTRHARKTGGNFKRKVKKYFIILPAALVVIIGTGYLLWAQIGVDLDDYPDAKEYAPNFWFDSEEKYYPADPLEFYYDENGKEVSGKAAVAKYNNLSVEEKLARAKIFYKADDTGNEFVYQYWLFYVMNNFKNGHYGDWESVFVFVDKESKNISKVVGSAHGSGNKLSNSENNNMWVYVGNGSHANCPVEHKGDICGSSFWENWEKWDGKGETVPSSGFQLIRLSQSYINNFHEGNSFDPSKSPTLGVNPLKVIRVSEVNIPFFNTKEEKYYNLPLIGEHVGQTPTFAWVKEEYHNPQEILTPTHTKIARNITGFFNNTGSFLAAVGRTVASPITNLFTAQVADTPADDGGQTPEGGLTPTDSLPEPAPIIDPAPTPTPTVASPTDEGGQTPAGGQTPFVPSPTGTTPTTPVFDEPELELALVTRVIDGDTVELASGQKLRYIGIDTPETSSFAKASEDKPNCFAEEATQKNKELVLNKQILLLQGLPSEALAKEGPTAQDNFGRLLRFVWQDVNLSGTIDSPDIFINRALVEGGYAYAFNFGETHAYDHVFEAAEAQAKRDRVGLWGDACHPSVEFLMNPKPIVRMYEPPSNNSSNDNDNDTTPPVAPISAIAEGTFFNASSDVNPEQEGYQINLSGTAEALSAITIIQNPTYTATSTEEGNWTREVTLISEGVNNFSITASDPAGNTSTSTLLTLNLDSIAPTSTISITNYSADSDQFKVNWATDADDIDIYESEYKTDETGEWQVWFLGGAVSKNFQNATTRTYYFHVRGIDTNQNVGPWQESEAVVIDLSSPVVINEIQIADAEFVELYNPSESQVSLKDYYFSYYPSGEISWKNPSRNQSFPNNAKISAKGHFLIGLDGYPETGGNPNADWQVYTSKQLGNAQGTIAIFPFDPTSATSSQYAYDNRGDAIGWGSAILLYESASATTTPAAGESLTRDSSHTDTDDNSADFTVATSTTPINSAGETYVPPEEGGGGGGGGPSPIETLPIVINEIQLADSEFVELYNSSTSTVSLAGYYLSYYPSNKDDWTQPWNTVNKAFPESAEITGGGYFLIGLNGYPTSGGNPNSDWDLGFSSGKLADSAGTVALFSFDPTDSQKAPTSQYAYDNRTDAVGWGSGIALYEGASATTTPAAGESLTRTSNHTDTDDNSADFSVATSTTPINSPGETYVPPPPPQNTNPVWAMYQKDARHSGLATLSGPAWTNSSQATTTWIFAMDFPSAGSQPAIDSAGVVYTTDGKGKLYAINPDGTLKWDFDPTSVGGVGSGFGGASPSLSSDSSRVYFVYTDSSKKKLRLFSIKTIDGSLDWKYNPNENGYNQTITSPILDESGNIYFAGKYTLYSISAAGSLNWEKKLSPSDINPNITIPAIDGEYLYVMATVSNNGGDRYIWKLNISDGSEVWKENATGNNVISNPVSVSASSTIYTGGVSDSRLYAIKPSDGLKDWDAVLGSGNVSNTSPNFDANGDIYVGTRGSFDTGKFYKVNATGTLAWSSDAFYSAVQFPAVIDGQGRVYVGARNKFIYALDSSDGSMIWEYELSDYAVGLAIGEDVVYAISYDGKVYALK